jgi:hypothetical protein
LIGQFKSIGIISSVKGFREVIRGGGIGIKGMWMVDGDPEI